MVLYFTLISVGLFSGFLAGLIGIGGGFITVPVLFFLLSSQGVELSDLSRTVTSTSLVIMIPTAISALISQYKRDMLDLAIVKRMVPTAAIGGVIGSFLINYFSSISISVIFVCYSTWFAIKLLMPQKEQVVSKPYIGCLWLRQIPDEFASAIIGCFSAIAGVGGTSLMVSFLINKGIEIRYALAASSALALSMAFSSSLTTMFNVGHQHIMWVVAFFIGSSAIISAPIGVKCSHALPIVTVRKIFGVFLLATSVISVFKLV